MSESLFCPRCNSLLVPKKGPKGLRSYCPSCGKYLDRLEKREEPEPGPGGFDLFPYKSIRTGQKGLMEDIKTVLRDRAVLIASAPTGIGKTAAALSVAVKHAKNNGKLVMFLTSKQSHHKIAVDTLREMSSRRGESIKVVDVISKRDMCPRPESQMAFISFGDFCKNQIKNHMCKFHEGGMRGVVKRIESSIMHVNELVQVCVNNQVCPHKAALEAAANADVLICDYNYIFSSLSETVLQRLGRGLENVILIIDEAHNLPDRILSHLDSTLTMSKVEEAQKEARPRDKRLYRQLLDLESRLKDLFTNVNEGKERYLGKAELDNILSKVLGQGLERIGVEDFTGQLIDVGEEVFETGANRAYCAEIAEFVETWNTEVEGMVRILSRMANERITVKLLDPSVLSAPVFKDCYSAVLMSGTLHPGEMFREVLGIGEARAMIRDYESPFPKENKLVLSTRGISTLYRLRGREMYNKMGTAIAAIVQSTDGNSAAFFPSYRILDDVAYTVGTIDLDRKVIIEERGMSKQEKEDILMNLERYKRKGALLMGVQGGSLSEGVDYADNLLSTIIIVGIPFAPPNLEVEALRELYMKRFGREKGQRYSYVYPALNRVIQAAGRLIRDRKDYGSVILLDERFLYSKYRSLLPPDLRPKAVKLDDLPRIVEDFFVRKA